MAEPVWQLFDDYAARWARGERPDARQYLDRAAAGAPELADLIDDHLQWAPPPPTEPDLVAEIAAWRRGEPPLLELRRRRGRSRAAVVDALMGALGIDPAKRSRVHDAYHRLETGQLRLAGVDARVFQAVAAALGARVADLVAWPGRQEMIVQAALMRDVLESAEASPDVWPAPGEPDEVDRLFGLG